MALWRKRQQETAGLAVTGGRLIMGWPGPVGTTIRLARSGDERAVARFIRMAGVEDDRPADDGIRQGSLSATLIKALDQGTGPLFTWVDAAVAAADDPSHLWPGMTLVLVALDEAGTPVGTLLAHPPMNVINMSINSGIIPASTMLATASVLVRMRAVAVEPRWQRQGIGAALIRHCLAIYDHLGYLVVYGQISTSEILEDYYPRFGFDVLAPRHGFSLANLIGVGHNVCPVPGEQLILQSRIRLTVSKVPAGVGG